MPSPTHKELYDDLPFDEFEYTPEMEADRAKEHFPVHEEPQIDTMDEPVVFECAFPGWQPGEEHYPAVPDGPEETIEELIDSVAAGAVALHVHPRDENGVPQLADHALLTRIYDAVFEECGDVVTLNHTWVPGTPESYHADYVTGTHELLEQGGGNKYCQGAVILPPNRLGGSAAHTMSTVKEGVRFMESKDIKPVFQLYDTHVVWDLKQHLINSGDASWEPFIMNIHAGKHHSHAIHQDPWSYLNVLSSIKTVEETVENSIVGVYPGGRNWLPILVHALTYGVSLIRVGIEDAYWKYPHRDEVIQKNSDVIELAVELAESLGREVITDPDRAREYLGLKYTS
jgi:uncharacterized protein (DUF849 family)